MNKALCVLLVLSCVAVPALGADSLRAEATATGTVVLWFSGEEVTADIHADVTVAGTLTLGDASTPFTLAARGTGSGKGDLATLAASAWVAVSGDGVTGAGAPISIAGGFSVDRLDSAATTAAKGTGRFYLVITTTTGRWLVEGDAAGTASGDFVVPDDRYSMQLEGTGAFSLAGEPHLWAPAKDETYPAWPASLLTELRRQAAEEEPGS